MMCRATEQARDVRANLADRVIDQAHSDRAACLTFPAHVVHALLRQGLAGQQNESVLRASQHTCRVLLADLQSLPATHSLKTKR